jgi:hypothetical protein
MKNRGVIFPMVENTTLLVACYKKIFRCFGGMTFIVVSLCVYIIIYYAHE